MCAISHINLKNRVYTHVHEMGLNFMFVFVFILCGRWGEAGLLSLDSMPIIVRLYGVNPSCTINSMVVFIFLLFEPVQEISNNVVCATSKGSDQPRKFEISLVAGLDMIFFNKGII